MTEVFEIKEPHYNLRSEASHFKRENVKSTHYRIQSVRHLGPKKWNIFQNIRESNLLDEFKSLIKFWRPDTCCPCRLCKTTSGFYLVLYALKLSVFPFQIFYFIWR